MTDERKRVLILANKTDWREIVMSLYAEKDLELVFTAQLQDALNKLSQEDFDIVFTDLFIGGWIEVVRAAAEANVSQRFVIAGSDHAREEVESKGGQLLVRGRRVALRQEIAKILTANHRQQDQP